MIGIAYRRFIDMVQKCDEQWRLDWMRDMRDPQAIGEAIINRPKDLTATQQADKLELMVMPKYPG